MGDALFPDPRSLGPRESVIWRGNDLSVERLVAAYRAGIFPWPSNGTDIPWHCPDPRGLMLFDRLHFPRSLKAAMRKNPFRFTFNKAFGEVIRACAEIPRIGEAGETWISEPMIQAYVKLNEEGWAHSVECWDGQTLVGGVYGVCVEGVFSGESMFYRQPNASKLALFHLIDALEKRGHKFLDIQMVTPVTNQLGAGYAPRSAFLDLLGRAHMMGFPKKLDLSEEP
jgi:leucyl/phenylalanyl-tRNA--protein transferase